MAEQPEEEKQEQEPQEEEQRPRMVLVTCDHCGARMRATQWREGLTCTKCGEGTLNPTVVPGGAIDYLLADRSQGYAIPDIRVAQWAKWTGLITPHQYDVAFVKQRQQVGADGPVEPIHEIMENQDFLAHGESVSILEFMTHSRPDEADEDFAARAIERQVAPEEKVRAVQDGQKQLAEKANEVPPLCQLLFEKRVIDESQLLALLNVQKQNGRGPLVTIPALIERNRKVSLYEKVAKGVKPPKHQMKNVALVVVVFMLAAAAWWWQYSRGQVKVKVICMETREVMVIPWPKEWPAKNPKTGQRTCYYLVKCQHCGREYGRKTPYRTAEHPMEKCPVCGRRTAAPVPVDE